MILDVPLLGSSRNLSRYLKNNCLHVPHQNLTIKMYWADCAAWRISMRYNMKTFHAQDCQRCWKRKLTCFKQRNWDMDLEQMVPGDWCTAQLASRFLSWRHSLLDIYNASMDRERPRVMKRCIIDWSEWRCSVCNSVQSDLCDVTQWG